MILQTLCDQVVSNRKSCSWMIRTCILPAQDPVLKDQVLNSNITHSKHGHVTRKNKMNGECSPFKTGSFLLVTWPCFEWVMLLLKTWSFKTASCAGRIHSACMQACHKGEIMIHKDLLLDPNGQTRMTHDHYILLHGNVMGHCIAQ